MHAGRPRASRARHAAGALVVATVALVASWAAADDAEEPIRLDYVAAPGCDARADLVRKIARAAPRARLVDEGETSRRLSVRIVRQGATFRADLVVEGARGTASARTLSTETCEQATRALALAIALSIDPHARVTAETAAASEGATEGDAGEDAAPADAGADAPPPPPPTRAAPATAPPATEARWAMGVGADADALVLIDGSPSVALGAHVEWGLAHGARVRGAFRRTFAQDVSVDALGGRFQWTWARLEGCPLRLGSKVEIVPCALGEIGEIDAEGTGGTSRSARARPWATLGVLGRVQARLGLLVASIDLAVAFPINRESFVFAPSPVVYGIPVLVPSLGISLGTEWSP